MALTDKLTNIADAIREKTGGTDALTLDGMAEAIAGIQAGGDTSVEDGLVTRNLTEYSNDRVKSVDSYAFHKFGSLKAVDLPNVETIGVYAFSGCFSLESINVPLVYSIGQDAFESCAKVKEFDFPRVISLGSYAFRKCSGLKSANLPEITSLASNVLNSCSVLESINAPKVTQIESNAVAYCPKITKLRFPKLASIGSTAFYDDTSLMALVIERGDRVCTLSNANAFDYTPIKNGTGYIYVPDALVEDYKAATNWSTYADQIKPLSEYVEVSE